MQLSILIKSIILILCVMVGMLVFTYLVSTEKADKARDTAAPPAVTEEEAGFQ